MIDKRTELDRKGAKSAGNYSRVRSVDKAWDE